MIDIRFYTSGGRFAWVSCEYPLNDPEVHRALERAFTFMARGVGAR